jgi:hypothetical protein
VPDVPLNITQAIEPERVVFRGRRTAKSADSNVSLGVA